MCFNEITNNCGQPLFNNWGWTNGPLTEGTHVFDMYAGAGQCNIDAGVLVGQLFVDYFDGTALVSYVTCGSYELDEVQLYVGNDILPRNNRNRYTVSPGQFPYRENDFNSGDQAYTFEVENLSGAIYVVAHAEVSGNFDEGDCGDRGCAVDCVEAPDFTGLDMLLEDAAGLDGLVTVNVNNPSLFGYSAYFSELTISNAEGTSLGGTWLGWCLDSDLPITASVSYEANLYSSYETLPDGLLENPLNLDRVNWIINQGFQGQTAACSGQTISALDIQRAIWTLVDNNLPTTFGTWNPCHVSYILDQAAAIDFYEPPCDGIMTVILVPVSAPAQILLAQIPALCTECP